MNYLRELKNRCDSEGVTSVLIMCDREGQLGASDSSERMMKIVLSHGYHGYIGIEHGERGREWESIVEIRDILKEVRNSLAG